MFHNIAILPSIIAGNEGMKLGKAFLMLHVYSFRASYSLASYIVVVEAQHRSEIVVAIFPLRDTDNPWPLPVFSVVPSKVKVRTIQ